MNQMNKAKTAEKYVVSMTRVSDGKVVEFEEEGWADSEDQDTLMNFDWGENNFSCDCNRHICFHRDGLKQDLTDESIAYEDAPCGESMYKVTIKNVRTGKIVLEEK